MDETMSRRYQPRVVFVDAGNRIVETGTDPAHAPANSDLIAGSAGGDLIAGSAGGDLRGSECCSP
jgi:aspartate 1-decarboxylase